MTDKTIITWHNENIEDMGSKDLRIAIRHALNLYEDEKRRHKLTLKILTNIGKKPTE